MTRCPYCSALTLRDPHMRPGTDEVCDGTMTMFTYMTNDLSESERAEIDKHLVSVMDLEESRAAPVDGEVAGTPAGDPGSSPGDAPLVISTNNELRRVLAADRGTIRLADPPVDAPATLPDEVKP